MKKIVHVIDSLQKGGAESLLVSNLKSLDKYENIVITLTAKNDYKSEVSNFDIYCLDYKLASFLSAVKKLKSLLESLKPDVVHSHLFWSNLVLKFATRKPSSLKVFYTNHTMLSFEAFKRIHYVYLEKWANRDHHHLISVSKTVEEDYKKFVTVSNSSVLYNFVPDYFFGKPKSFDRSSGRLKCVAVGTNKYAKNYPFIVNNFTSNLNITLDIYGRDDTESSLQKLVDNRKVNNVRYHGQSDSISEELKKYDLFILGSIYEGQPISALEAMATGMPVLFSDIPVLKEAGGHAAIYFNSHELNDLSSKLESALVGYIDLNTKSQLCFARANELARKEVHISTLEKLYES